MSSDKTEALRRAYMKLGEVCTALGEMSREAGEESAGLLAGEEAPLERLRQEVARARMDVWSGLKEQVWIDWLNANETPDLFCKYPPKDMPRRPQPPADLPYSATGEDGGGEQ